MFMLDTDICICLLNRRPGYEDILARIDGMAYEQVVISAITLAELKYGIAKSVKKAANRTKLDFFLHQFECLPFDVDATACYGNIRAQLEAQGIPIGPLDMLIAAHAQSVGAIVVTNNVREFGRVANLTVENWLNPRSR
jgi:tRNA(fMet)-specific endonuclease VapC